MGPQTLSTIVVSIVVITTLLVVGAGAVAADSGFDQPPQDNPYDCNDPEPGYEGYTCTDEGSVGIQDNTETSPTMTAPDNDGNNLEECEAAGKRMAEWHNSNSRIGVITQITTTAHYGHCVSENTD